MKLVQHLGPPSDRSALVSVETARIPTQERGISADQGELTPCDGGPPGRLVGVGSE